MTIELKEFLNIELNLENNLASPEIAGFYNVIEDYLNNRSKIETLEKNIIELRNLLRDFGLSDREIIGAIQTNPSYIHADKTELAIKFYLLGKIVDSKTGKGLRNEIIVNKGKYLRTNYNLIYARIKHLMFLADNNEILRNENIIVRKIFKITNDEFEESYGISRDALLSCYPFTINALQEIRKWPENVVLIQREETLNEANRKK